MENVQSTTEISVPNFHIDFLDQIFTKGYFPYKTEKVNTSIEFSIFELLIINFSLN